MSISKLVEVLLSLRGATFVTFLSQITPELKKNPFKNIQKLCKVNGVLNFWYAAGVIRRLEKEGKVANFKQGTSWHKPIIIDGILTPLCQHKTNDNLYLRFMHLKTLRVMYKSENREIPEKEIAPYLKYSTYANQGLRKPLVFLTYSLDAIKEIRLNNQLYTIAS